MRTATTKAAWRAGPLIPSLPQTSSLDIYDLRAASPETVLSVSSLAGLVNRGQAKIYLVENDDDEFWLEQVAPALPRTRTPVTGDLLEHLLIRYREHVGGLIIYDPALLDTRNVASTLAALRSGLVVSPEQARGLQGAPYSAPVLADLRIHGWKTRLQAYAWAYQHLLAECSPDLLAGLNPGVCGGLRSFLVTQRVFTCWLDARRTLPSPTLGWLCERSLFKRVLANFHPGAVHLGWFVSEPFGIRLTSSSALLTFASDHCTNLAVWSSLPGNPIQADTRVPVGVSTGQDITDEREYGRKTYLSFTISEGDNLQYCQHRLLRLWRDPARGSLPLGWTIAPALKQVMPDMAAFYYRTATENDTFIAGPSGAAYILPSLWPHKHRVAFLQLSAEFMRAMNLAHLQVLDSRSWFTWFNMRFLNPGLQKIFAAQLTACGLRGIFSGAGDLYPSWHLRAGLPIYQNLGLALNSQRALHLIRSAIARGTRFINIYIFAWTINPGDLQRIMEQLGDEVCVVSPARLLELLEQESKPVN